jgi:flagellar basal body-associated protein FliL
VEVKKAKLDLWESIPGLDEQEIAATQVPGGAHTVVQAGIIRRWATNKLLIVGVPAAVALLLVVSVALLFVDRTIKQRQTARIPTQYQQQAQEVEPAKELTALEAPSVQEHRAAAPEKTEIVYFTDFMIDLKDARGNSHVLICDVAFEIAERVQKDRMEKNTLLRNAIYRAAQTRSVVALRSTEERKKLKKDFSSALDGILGEGSVKDVYFVNYLII